MISNKVVLEGKIVSIGQWHEARNGSRVRDFNVMVDGTRTQYYCLTEVVQKGEVPRILVEGHQYRFEGYVNGLKLKVEEGGIHVNKILIHKLWKSA